MKNTDAVKLDKIKTNEITDILIYKNDYTLHYDRKRLRDEIAFKIVHFSAHCADLLFKKRYTHRAIVLETIAAVPGMVGGLLQHLKSLRLIKDDLGWIKALLEEAENERMHLLIYSEIAEPTLFERLLIMFIQFFFYNLYFLLYLFTPYTAHRVVGYFEEEAIHSYTRFLEEVDENEIKNVPATALAKKYWHLNDEARLRDMILKTRDDEVVHRDTNHALADKLI